jgi:predicted small integral membrane protein
MPPTTCHCPPTRHCRAPLALLCSCREKSAWIGNLVMSVVWVAVIIALIVVLSMNGNSGYYYYD